MKSSDQGRCLRVHQQEGILSLALNKPPWNVLTTEMLKELEALLKRGSTDGGARALLSHSAPVLRGYKRALLQASTRNEQRLREMEELYLN